MNRDTAEMLHLLGYQPRWLESGLLDAAALADQVARYRRGEDPNAEHFRWESFTRAMRDGLSDQRVAAILELAVLDPDAVMAKSAVSALLQAQDLTETQFEMAYRSTSALSKIVARAQLLRLARRPDASPGQLFQCARDGDREVHRALLDRPVLSTELTELLVAAGANRAVRNLARRRLERVRIHEPD